MRFSSLESLGFSDAASVWSDSPVLEPDSPKGRHVAPPRKPETMADWRPEDFTKELTGGDVRWSLLVILTIVVAGLGGLGYWLYQRPAAEEEASIVTVRAQAEALRSAVPTLEQFNVDMLVAEVTTGTSALFEVETIARTLFTASASLAERDTDLRSASTEAAGSAIDGIRLAGDAYSYRSAVIPLLTTPDLETDPSLIPLDEAARSFGAWQLGFDEVRTALPDAVLPEVTRQIDILSGDLTSIMGRYVDALRNDDASAARDVLSDLEYRLAQVGATLDTSLGDIQRRVAVRIGETQAALGQLLDN